MSGFQLKVAKRLHRSAIRQQLADAQISLVQAIQERDPEAITEARRALAQALERLRGLT